jgi:hypothetical protein
MYKAEHFFSQVLGSENRNQSHESSIVAFSSAINEAQMKKREGLSLRGWNL